MLTMPTQSELRRTQSVNPGSRFQRTPNTTLGIDDEARGESDTVLAQISTSENAVSRVTATVEMPRKYIPLLRWLAEREESFSLAELEEGFRALDRDEHIELVQVLARANFLKLLWFPRLEKG